MAWHGCDELDFPDVDSMMAFFELDWEIIDDPSIKNDDVYSPLPNADYF